MIIQFFKKNYTRQIALFGLVSVVLWFPAFLVQPDTPHQDFLIPFADLFYTTDWISWWIKHLAGFFLVVLEGIYLNYILVKHGLSSKMSFFPALLYVVLMSSDPRWLTLHPLLITNLFFLLALGSLLRSYDVSSPYELIFNSGFFITCGSLFYPPFLFLAPLLFICFFVYRFYGWREWVLALLGLITPWFFSLCYLYLTDSSVLLKEWFALNTELLSNLALPKLSISEKIFGGILLLFLMFSVSYFHNHTRDKGLSQRKKNIIFSYAVLLSIPATVYAEKLGTALTILSPTIAYLYSFFFFGKRKTKRSDLYLIIFFTFVAVYYIFHIVKLITLPSTITY